MEFCVLYAYVVSAVFQTNILENFFSWERYKAKSAMDMKHLISKLDYNIPAAFIFMLRYSSTVPQRVIIEAFTVTTVAIVGV